MNMLAVVTAGLFLSTCAFAANKWIPVGHKTPHTGQPLLNVGHVTLNGNGNRVASIRIPNPGGFRMEIVTEFDCHNKSQRALASAITDKEGNLVTASGVDNIWYPENEAVGLSAACKADLSTE